MEALPITGPDLIVGVDFGTTFTGVTWVRCNRPRAPIQVVKDWPHSEDGEERKVPSLIMYTSSGQSISSWGFSCQHDPAFSQRAPLSLFKLFLDRRTLETAQSLGQRLGGATIPQSHEDALRVVTDYLRCVYEHVRGSICEQLGIDIIRNDGVLGYNGISFPSAQTTSWNELSIDFVFSVPTTWTALEIVHDLERCVKGAGFGSGGPRHTATIDLTEAEAAAVAVLKNSAVDFAAGDMFLCVDAGGGTTDLALCRVTSADVDYPQMEQVAAVRGVGVGASLIDRAFAAAVQARIDEGRDAVARGMGGEKGGPVVPLSPEQLLRPDCAEFMARGVNFRTVKHSFGKRAWRPPYRIRVEELSAEHDLPSIGVESGSMLFSEEEMMALFDPHIEHILAKIRKQLDWLGGNGFGDTVRYMILSGGLGKSEYVRSRLKQSLDAFPHSSAQGMQVLLCEDAQLVVARGLLLDRQQSMLLSANAETGQITRMPVLASRIARASYGVVVREPFVEGKHDAKDMYEDQFDRKKKWARNQINWVIRKGMRIGGETIKHPFHITLAAGDVTRAWDATVVVYHGDGEPPKSMRNPQVVRVCAVRSNLDGVQQSELLQKQGKRRGGCLGMFGKKGEVYFVCQFDVVVVVAPADLRFELYFAGQRFSRNHEPISVSWDEEGTRKRISEDL